MKNIYLIFIPFLLFSTVYAQSPHVLFGESNSLIIKGTSSAHDWESKAENLYGEAIIVINEGLLKDIEILSFSVESKSIKSGKRIMDSKTRGALKEKNYSLISFNLTEVSEIRSDSIEVLGTLSLAGVNQEITLAAAYQVGEDESLQIFGMKLINMEDYGIKPPKALMGTLKTGKDVEVEFNISFRKN